MDHWLPSNKGVKKNGSQRKTRVFVGDKNIHYHYGGFMYLYS
jgi:hypothetical protein